MFSFYDQLIIYVCEIYDRVRLIARLVTRSRGLARLNTVWYQQNWSCMKFNSWIILMKTKKIRFDLLFHFRLNFYLKNQNHLTNRKKFARFRYRQRFFMFSMKNCCMIKKQCWKILLFTKSIHRTIMTCSVWCFVSLS